MEFFLNGADFSLNSMINHMKGAQFNDPVSHMCLVGIVVALLSFTQDVTGSSPFR